METDQKHIMHSLEASASLAGYVSVALRDIVGGRISPNINVDRNTKFDQFKETFSPLRLVKFH